MSRAGRFPRRNRAFTLVELLIVVAIIALLAAIALPGMSRAREYAYFTRCKSRLRQICIAFLIFASDNNGRLPEADTQCRIEAYGYPSYCSHYRRIGVPAHEGVFNGGGGGKQLIEKIYSEECPGYYWDGGLSGYPSLMMGRPREKGKYLPIEMLWDPMADVRG